MNMKPKIQLTPEDLECPWEVAKCDRDPARKRQATHCGQMLRTVRRSNVCSQFMVNHQRKIHNMVGDKGLNHQLRLTPTSLKICTGWDQIGSVGSLYN